MPVARSSRSPTNRTPSSGSTPPTSPGWPGGSPRHPTCGGCSSPSPASNRSPSTGCWTRRAPGRPPKGSYAEPVAEHALLLALAGLRYLPRRVVARSWGDARAPVSTASGSPFSEAAGSPRRSSSCSPPSESRRPSCDADPRRFRARHGPSRSTSSTTSCPGRWWCSSPWHSPRRPPGSSERRSSTAWTNGRGW